MDRFLKRKLFWGTLILIICLCFGAVVSVEISGTCEDNLTWVLNDDGVLTISGKGEMQHFSSEMYDSYWFPYRDSIQKVVITNGITNIGECAFQGCVNLTDVSIPNSVKSLDYGCFGDCNALSGVKLPAGLEFIGDYAFTGCNLQSIKFPSGLVSIGNYAFQLCPFRSLPFPSGLVSIGTQAFNNCENLSGEIVLPASLTEFGWCVFAGTNHISAYVVEPGNPSLKSVDGILYTADMKTLIIGPIAYTGSIIIPEGVETIETGAVNYTQASEIKLPSTLKVIESSALACCPNIQSIVFPEGLSALPDTVLYWCSNLNAVSLPDTIERIGYAAFMNCFSLTDISIPDNVKEIADQAFESCFSLTQFESPKKLETIGERAFQQCSSITTVVLEPALRLIDENAFSMCGNITEVFFHGTERQWKKISIASGNESLLNATFSFLPEATDIDIAAAEIDPIKDREYTGKKITPKITVKYDGETLTQGIDYTLSWKNNKSIGTAMVTVKGQGRYTGTKETTFNIIPKAVTLSSLESKTKSQLKAIWKKSSGITGYELEYGLKKKLTDATNVIIGKSKTNYTLKDLRSKKTYYVRIRAYKTVKGVKYYSAWSKVLRIKVK